MNYRAQAYGNEISWSNCLSGQKIGHSLGSLTAALLDLSF